MADEAPELKTTPLSALHRELGARMAEFAGYIMPIQYDYPSLWAARCSGGIMAEHLHCRERAALFDVSHMGQARLSGAGIAAALERLTPADVQGLKPGRQRYALLTNEAGGIVDDVMIGSLGEDELFLVVNASRAETDFTHIASELPRGLRIKPLEDRGLLALQGPLAAAVIERLAPGAERLPFMGLAEMMVTGVPAIVSRSGYTGEDGFEISVAADRVEALARQLLESPELIMAGLGARDSLRLEAGLCLYGSDIDEVTTPVEAALEFAIARRRREVLDYIGAGPIRDHLNNHPPRRRVGIKPDGRAPARAGTEIAAGDGTDGGMITSGGFSPTLGAPIAMGYVRRDLAADGTPLELVVRGRRLPARVVPLPFVPHRYAR
jgi:aminomethyltransferase